MITLESLSKGQQTRAPRMVILGVEKIGKTSFACGCHFDETGALAETGLNAPVVIPCKGEEGTDSLDVTTFPTATTAEESTPPLSIDAAGPATRRRQRTASVNSSRKAST